MNKYQALATVALHAGRVALDKHQAAARAHCLRAIKNGVYEILSPIQFKAGEVIGYDGELPKALEGAMSDPNVHAGKAREDAKKAAEEEKVNEATAPTEQRASAPTDEE